VTHAGAELGATFGTVPEPSTSALAALGLLGVLARRVGGRA
jgi:hypothetical protein